MIGSSQLQQEINRSFLRSLWLDQSLREESIEFLNSLDDCCATIFIACYFIARERDLIEQRIAKLRMKKSMKTKFVSLLACINEMDATKHEEDRRMYPVPCY